MSKVSESVSPSSNDNFQLSPNSRFFVVRVPNKDAIKSHVANSTPNPIVPINISNTDATQKCTNQQNQNNDNLKNESQIVLNNDNYSNSTENCSEKLEFLFEPETKDFGHINLYTEVVKNDVIEKTTSLLE